MIIKQGLCSNFFITIIIVSFYHLLRSYLYVKANLSQHIISYLFKQRSSLSLFASLNTINNSYAVHFFLAKLTYFFIKSFVAKYFLKNNYSLFDDSPLILLLNIFIILISKLIILKLMMKFIDIIFF
jgi:hypothetical protein